MWLIWPFASDGCDGNNSLIVRHGPEQELESETSSKRFPRLVGDE